MASRAEKLPAMPPPSGPVIQVPTGLRVAYAKHVLYNHLNSRRIDMQYGHHLDANAPERDEPLPRLDPIPSEGPDSPPSELPEFKPRVAIVGAGATGLYLAMMLKYLEIPNVDIYEASDRIGGRCYTYKFPEDKDCPHNYYDVGAMRIPDIPAMNSTLRLIEELKLKHVRKDYVLSAGVDSDRREPHMYWYSSDDEPKGARYFKRLKQIIALNKDKEFMEWVNKTDEWSTRAYLMHRPDEKDPRKPLWTYNETEEAESAATSTGLFDQSIIESVCDYSDFQATTGKLWYRIDGGMSVVTDKMNEYIEDPKSVPHSPISLKVTKESPVVAMSENLAEKKIELTVSSKEGLKTESYDMVFNTTAMGPLQRMDISGLVKGFGPERIQKKILTGIRALSYDRACKVAIKFKTRWWKGMYKGLKPNYGGVSASDLSISNVVYPSWDDGDKPAVLIVSYTWAQDATRMGALIPDYSKQKPSLNDTVATQCIENLAKLWAKKDPTITTEFLRNQYVTHHAHAWAHDVYTGGAFALFGPGQFKYVYPEFQTLLCDGKFAICGEALSAHHAWISGALDSGYITMLRWLRKCKQKAKATALEESWFGNGQGEHVEEFDEQLMQWSIKLGSEIAKNHKDDKKPKE
ncbi:amino acid oxidase [Fusarium mexicanum]|uniref:Amino acid oxidase n=1 Tax=Fusarium mexicanum TaxID=751941 RepID=A0A8H5J978_9HYPO|nr:amino acid oxidase [Fusarium mexicanum]